MDAYNERTEVLREMAFKIKHPELNAEINVTTMEDKKAIVNKHIKSVYIERYEKTGTKIIINDGINYLYRPKKEGLIRI